MKDNFDVHKWNLERYLNESQESKQTNENQERKQTAVEWLFEQYKLVGMLTTAQVEKAKEIEKEQIIEFANSFYDECGMQYGGLEQSAEEYYQETYGK